MHVTLKLLITDWVAGLLNGWKDERMDVTIHQVDHS